MRTDKTIRHGFSIGIVLLAALAAGCGHGAAPGADAAPGVRPPSAGAPPPPMVLRAGAGALRGRASLPKIKH